MLLTTCVIFVVFTHIRYTVDVICAVMVTIGCWFVYMALLQRAVDERQSHHQQGVRRNRVLDEDAHAWWWSAMMVRRDLGASAVAWFDGLDLRWEAVGSGSGNISVNGWVC